MTPRFCYYISVTDRDENGFIPSVVFENEPGYQPLSGNGIFAQPWYWGKTYPEAVEFCKRMNNGPLELSDEDVVTIIASSMRAQGFD